MSGGDILYLENKQYLLISFSTMSLNISIREIKENAQSHLDGIWMKVAMVMHNLCYCYFNSSLSVLNIGNKTISILFLDILVIPIYLT